MKKLPIFLGALVVIALVVVLSLSPGKVYSANVGDVLTAPESGWTRYETDSQYSYYSSFSFAGSWIEHPSNVVWSGYSTMYTSDPTATISFTFTGSGLRIISSYYGDRSSHTHVTIDGTTYDYSAYSTGIYYQTLCFNITGLGSSGQHQVTISNQDSGSCLEVDAIDIYGGSLDGTPTPSPTPVTTPSPTPATTPSTDLCYDYTIVGSVGSFNPGTLSNGSQVSQSFTVTDAELGDFVKVSFSQNLQGVALFGYVSAADQVTVVFQNGTGSNVTLSSGTVRVHVSRHIR